MDGASQWHQEMQKEAILHSNHRRMAFITKRNSEGRAIHKDSQMEAADAVHICLPGVGGDGTGEQAERAVPLVFCLEALLRF